MLSAAVPAVLSTSLAALRPIPLAAQGCEASAVCLRSPPERASATPVLPTPGWSPETAALVSAIVPGAGQFARGQRRWVGYAVAEVVAWALVIDRRHRGGRLRDRYRDLAWTVAREGLTGSPRSDGDFEYYEDLSDWQRSGSFDDDSATPGLQPEPDPGTFNGGLWELARDRFFPPGEPDPEPGDPTYERALAHYESRAYGPGFLWDWSDDPASWARFGDTIGESDERFRQATLFTGAVVANHLTSAVDAFVSARLSEAAGRPARLTSHVVADPRGRWSGARLDLSLSLYIRPPGHP